MTAITDSWPDAAVRIVAIIVIGLVILAAIVENNRRR